MKTIRLLYPDYVSGNLETYYFGSYLLQHLLPQNDNQKLLEVDVIPPSNKEKKITNGIYAEDEVIYSIKDAQKKLEKEAPDRIITIGGNCMVSFAPFDYLHTIYDSLGIIWLDAHPDVTTINDGYPYANAMVLGSLLGAGAGQIASLMKGRRFKADEILYVGLQPLHSYQKEYLDNIGLSYKIQSESFVSESEILAFAKRFDHILIHFDIDVLSEKFFHSTYFSNPDLVGDGSHGGKMRIEELERILRLISDNSDVVGFTIAEYLPFDEEKLSKVFSSINIFTD